MTDIVIVKNNIPFRLSEVTTAAIEQARVSLTDLARLLGYKEKARLKDLATRHAEQLAELSGNHETFTVNVSVQRGPVKFDTTEMAFNQPQVMYLVGHADTPNAKALSVQYVKGFFMLLNHVLAVEEHLQATTLAAQQPQAPTSLRALAAEVQTLKQGHRVHTDAIKDLRLWLASLDTPTLAALPPAEEPRKVVELAPGVKLYSISDWRKKHPLTRGPVSNTSLGRTASALFRDTYDKKDPPKEFTEEINGARRRVGVYPANILIKAFKITPLSKKATRQ